MVRVVNVRLRFVVTTNGVCRPLSVRFFVGSAVV